MADVEPIKTVEPVGSTSPSKSPSIPHPGNAGLVRQIEPNLNTGPLGINQALNSLARRLPGGPYIPKPFVMDGKMYEPHHPPQLRKGKDGKVEAVGGKQVKPDEMYAQRFWDRQPPGMREVMIENIHSAAEKGSIGSFTDPKGISETDREKLSAYRLLAEELGYEVGSYVRNPKTYTASAPIKKRT